MTQSAGTEWLVSGSGRPMGHWDEPKPWYGVETRWHASAGRWKARGRLGGPGKSLNEATLRGGSAATEPPVVLPLGVADFRDGLKGVAGKKVGKEGN